MNPAEEFREVVVQIRNLLTVDMEMGLDPPEISPDVFKYIKTGPRTKSPPNSLEDLREFIGDCRRCKLWNNRTNLVFGEGSPRARLVFVGEGPGQEEDHAGRPFVGEAGRLLTKIIEKGMGLSRDDVYICNVVKCRPPNNRDPESDEIETCIPFLRQQLDIIRPEVICVLGRIAGQALLNREIKITKERGIWQSYMGIPVMPTYHPAYIVRNPSRERDLKGQVWKDVQEIMARLGLEVRRNG